MDGYLIDEVRDYCSVFVLLVLCCYSFKFSLQANEHGYVYVAVDWKGLCDEDVVTIGLMLLTNLTDFRIVPDRLHQGMLDALYSMRMMVTSFKDDPSMQVNGSSIIRDSSKTSYYGNSCGGIYGTVYMGVSQDVTEGVIGVGGAPFSLLLPRSVDFEAMRDIMYLAYSGTLERPALLAIAQVSVLNLYVPLMGG